jgi:hypothetical protein
MISVIVVSDEATLGMPLMAPSGGSEMSAVAPLSEANRMSPD